MDNTRNNSTKYSNFMWEEIVPRDYRKCPSCSIYKHDSKFNTSKKVDVNYCDQCVGYISEIYNEYVETIKSHTGYEPESPNVNISSAKLFSAHRYFSYSLDAHILPEIGISSLPNQSVFIDMPVSNVAGRPVIATFRNSGQRLEFDNYTHASKALGDPPGFIKAQCMTFHLMPTDSEFYDTLTEEERTIVDASKLSGYQYNYKHNPLNIGELVLSAKLHVDICNQNLDEVLQLIEEEQGEDDEDILFKLNDTYIEDELDLDEDFKDFDIDSI